MNAHHILKAVVKALEWSGSVQGPGSGPMFSGGDGTYYAACPACGWLMRPNGDFDTKAVGHKPNCPVKAILELDGYVQ
jgi:hypothetical protein